eukprot:scaffold338_cov116-Cylindrotheca_fusiformis.AAC.12
MFHVVWSAEGRGEENIKSERVQSVYNLREVLAQLFSKLTVPSAIHGMGEEEESETSAFASVRISVSTTANETVSVVWASSKASSQNDVYSHDVDEVSCVLTIDVVWLHCSLEHGKQELKHIANLVHWMTDQHFAWVEFTFRVFWNRPSTYDYFPLHVQ